MLTAALVFSAMAQAAIPIQHWQHASGAQVYLVESRSLPMLDVQINVDGGSRRDPAAQAGLSAATAGMFSAGVGAVNGMPPLDENQIGQAWTDLGAQFEANATSERFSLSLRTLTESAIRDQAVALAARQMAAPGWPEAVWRRDRERTLAAMKEAETRPTTHAARAFSQAVYGDHPYGFEPRPETLLAIGVADIKRFYERHVVPCRAQVTLVGDIGRDQADELVGRLMEAIASHGCPALTTVPEVEALTAPADRRIPFDAAQAQVLIGQPGIRRSDPDYFPIFVGNYILGGGGFVSRLTTEVREKRGLSYSVYSYFAPGLHAGAFQLGLSTRPDQAEQALAVAQDVVARFVAEGPTQAELDAAKDYLLNSFALRLDSNRKLLDNVANMAWHGLPMDYLETWKDRVRAVSQDDVKRAFRRVLQPGRMVTVVVGGR